MKKASYQQYRKSLLLLLLLNLLGDIAFALPISSIYIHIFILFLYVGMGASGAYFFHDISRINHRLLYIISILTILYACSAIIGIFVALFLLLSFAILTLLKIALFFFLSRYIFKKSRHTNDIVIAIITTFLLLGSIYSFSYFILQQIYITFFHMPIFKFNDGTAFTVNLQNLFFYSYALLTHTGLTDISPTIYFSKFLTTTESIISTLYIIFTTAHLASMYSNWKNKPNYYNNNYNSKKTKYSPNRSYSNQNSTRY